jgi:hypothetical protein
MRRLIDILWVSLFVSQLSATMARAQSVLNDTQPPGTTFLCRFTDGPRAGRTQPLAGRTDKVAARAESSCSDGISSTGVVIASQGDAPAPVAVGSACSDGASSKAHGWHDYAPLPPARLGGPCQDGESSAGIVMASGHGQPY